MITLKNILVATDFSECSDTALTYGRELASRFDATLHLLHVVQNVSAASFGMETIATMGPDMLKRFEEDARTRLHQLTIDSDRSGPRTVTAVNVGHSAPLDIVEYAKTHEINLIVMGTHGRGAIAHFLMGSVAERVVRLAQCPVLTVRHPEREFVVADETVKAAAAGL